MRANRRIGTILLLLVSACDRGALAVDLYVAPSGKIEWSGTLPAANAEHSDGPLPSIAAARDLIRSRRASGMWTDEAITVHLRGGVYYLEETVVFEPRDSGTPGKPIVYAAYKNEQPILSGGRVIGGWRDAEINGRPCWVVEIPEVKEGKWYFRQLFVNGRRCPRPQVPEQGWYQFAGIPPHSERYLKRENVRDKANQNDRACYRPGHVKKWHNLGDVEFVCLMSWDEAHLFAANLDEATRTIEFTQPSYLGADKVITDDKNGRYYMLGVREALNKPGQWYLDRVSGMLYYLPVAGETPDNTTVVAPRLNELLCVLGDEPRNPLEERNKTFWTGPRLIGQGPTPRPIEHLALRGLTLKHNNWFLPPDKSAGGQAMARLPAALFLLNARNCRITDCTVSQISNWAIELGAECRDNVISGCTLTDLGAGGVKLNEDSHHNTVTDCEISNGGLVFPGAAGVWVGHSWANTVSHNHIHHLYYTGISVGWVWGYSRPSKAACNIIEYNHIHHIGRKLLSDMGGIYTLGSSPGTVLRYNLIHDVEAFAYGGHGLYNDEGSSFVLLENNIVYRTSHESYHQNYGQYNVIRNNVFAYSADGTVNRSGQNDPFSFTIEHNIVYSTLPRMLDNGWRWNKSGNFKMDYNLYWREDGQPFDFPGDRSFEQWQQWWDQDRHSIIADPLFVDPKNGDFRLKAGSPAERIGFKPIDTSRIGRLKSHTPG
ncbi:MAG TPA: right-handed parallel beta-helix repeat-containing protein [Phycisphaerae bacterium]|nr:right-handed parallel beta-helix repeat-containing protein [Phycisphaerae bacterium]HRR85412.1 right-handed parallel beta-helix repeat-containing protein [Phycisphaerae bacterium]